MNYWTTDSILATLTFHKLLEDCSTLVVLFVVVGVMVEVDEEAVVDLDVVGMLVVDVKAV